MGDVLRRPEGAGELSRPNRARYYDVVADDERERVIARFRRLMEEWQELGARVVATLDDDLFMVGEPGSPRFTFYLMFEVDDPQVVVEMIAGSRAVLERERRDSNPRPPA